MKKNNFVITVVTIVGLSILLYLLFFRSFAKSAYCRKKTDMGLYDFRQSIQRNGANPRIEENADINKFLSDMYNDCIE